MPQTRPLIQMKNLSKIYRINAKSDEQSIQALDQVNLEIFPGEFVAIIGQSGSGKSTLMNLIGILDSPTSGEYLLNGQDLSRLNDRKLSEIRSKEIGFIFQGFHLIAELNAEENVELPLIYRGIKRTKRQQLAQNALAMVGLQKRIHHYPNQISGGQQQRVAIARAIAANPPIILADEPTGNLDRKSGDEVMQILHRLHREGHTIVLITHDLAIAQTADRMIQISDGKILADIKDSYGI